MTDKISKALAKFTDKERRLVAEILTQLKHQNLDGLQVVKLKGHDDIFRVKKGRLRIIYRDHGNLITVLAIERRSEKTYRNF